MSRKIEKSRVTDLWSIFTYRIKPSHHGTRTNLLLSTVLTQAILRIYIHVCIHMYTYIDTYKNIRNLGSREGNRILSDHQRPSSWRRWAASYPPPCSAPSARSPTSSDPKLARGCVDEKEKKQGEWRKTARNWELEGGIAPICIRVWFQ